MGYLTAKEFSKKWNITERRIIKLCKENRIDGAMKNGMVWLIPEETIKPSDKRRKISKYIPTEKNIVIFNLNNDIGEYLIPIVKKEGYNIKVINSKKTLLKENLSKQVEIINSDQDILNISEKVGRYLDGLIYIDFKAEKNKEDKEKIIKEFSNKMDFESSIVIVNDFKESNKNLLKLPDKLEKNIGIRMNWLELKLSENRKIIIDYRELANDVFSLLVNYKNTFGETITTDCGYIEFNQNLQTEPLETGKFYKVLNYYFKKLDKTSHFWAASTMLEDEWTEEPLEMQFRRINLEAANRCASFERIFIFSYKKIEEFKNNKTLKIYMQNTNIKTLYVDYDEILEKESDLLEIVANGWDGFNDEALIVDLLGEQARGYVSIDKKEIKKAYDCFLKLKKYSKDLRDILK